MTLKYCQGPACHKYTTKDRLKGSKGNKTYQTRRRSSMLYGNNFCSQHCADDWFETYGDRSIDHFGRLTEPKHLTEDNAWVKDYDWGNGSYSNDDRTYYFINQITKEQRPLTREQYRDSNYTINTGE
jgi:hypothetical protein